VIFESNVRTCTVSTVDADKHR